jgi:N,N-dimethylformamidase beta subunit-like protein
MLRLVTRSAAFPPLLGYADRFSVAPGETIQFMVSSEVPRYRARLVRLIQGDESPDGPGYAEELVESSLDGEYAGRRQGLVAGSYVRVPAHPSLALRDGFTVQLWLWPTTPSKAGGQGLVARWPGFALELEDGGRLQLSLAFEDGGTRRVIHPGPPLVRWQWTFACASYDAATGLVRLVHAPAGPYAPVAAFMHEDPVSAAGTLAGASEDLFLACRGLAVAGEDGRQRPVAAYNGKLDRPRLFGRALSIEEVESLRHHGVPPADALVAAWDFASGIGTDGVADGTSNQLHGMCVNMPTRAVTDHTWSGREVRWKLAADEYQAIHFHDDDLEDTGWQPDFRLSIPSTLRSGVYAAHLETDGDEEYIPFFVGPPPGTATAPVAFLAPTLTYMAYANERQFWNPDYTARRARVTPLTTLPPELDQFMAEHRELGLSLYDVHSDGSGCCYSSRLRPILNMRPKYRAWRLHDAPRHFAADLYLVAWLEAREFAYDVITDEDLHHHGSELLKRYRVVLTGSHPEYVTEPMRAAVRGYLDSGGRLMYLGGNGFYWVTAIDPLHPHVIEVRRGVSGTRAWESLAGEWYHSTDAALGGLWRLRGWAPQRLVGVGFAAQGWGGAAAYIRLPDSLDPRVAFIFDGIGEDEPIGDFGLGLGGAAGDEIDRFDRLLGSPANALVLATSAGQHSDYYQVTVEDVTSMVPGQGGTESPKVRADMVFFETPDGGAVFSVGSINWLSSLAWNRFDNNVARVTENVLRRFLDAQPFSAA